MLLFHFPRSHLCRKGAEKRLLFDNERTAGEAFPTISQLGFFCARVLSPNLFANLLHRFMADYSTTFDNLQILDMVNFRPLRRQTSAKYSNLVHQNYCIKKLPHYPIIMYTSHYSSPSSPPLSGIFSGLFLSGN